MATQKWIDDRFRKRLKDEREDRNWSQAETAKMLSDKGIPMHVTTIAKIEKGDRSVRIDEAAGIADLFGTSVDSMLGRAADTRNETGLARELQLSLQLARQGQVDIQSLRAALSNASLGLRVAAGWQPKDAAQTLIESYDRACGALSEADRALTAALTEVED